MRKAKQIKFKLLRWIYSEVLKNKIITVVLTAVISTLITLYFRDIIEIMKTFYLYFILFILIILELYYRFSYEKVIKKVNLTEENLEKDWVNNELRPNIPSAAFVNDNALQLQFMDIPFTLSVDLPDKYALEFKTKVLNDCFAWCVNANINNKDMQAYMFQYSPFTRMLRPHFLTGYDETVSQPTWLFPVPNTSPEAPLKCINDLILQDKESWYFIRTEVARYKKDVKKNLDSVDLNKIAQLYNNQKITYNEDRQNEVVEIRIYDMNDLGKEMYHIFFNEPRLKCFVGHNVGFRNCNFESALYKNIVLKELR